MYRTDDTSTTEDRRNSSGHRQVLKCLRFVNGPGDSLATVEFEAALVPSILNTLHQALTSLQVCISDSETRLTAESLSQRFQLTEQDGGPLLGERRQAVENAFLTTLSVRSNDCAHRRALLAHFKVKGYQSY